MREMLLHVSHKEKDKMRPTYFTGLLFVFKLVLWTEVVLSVWYPREQRCRGKLPSLANTNLSVWAECSSTLQSVAKQAQICSSGRSPKSAKSSRQRTTAKYLRNGKKCILLTVFCPYWLSWAQGVAWTRAQYLCLRKVYEKWCQEPCYLCNRVLKTA